ncbi:putative multi-domain containing protein [Aduncisulcus paluster]|uniref:V-type proton ATPase proteolipid subunit n=1 Tax=Aduncisulcus paluster TaxID=2918883 RepID=A0ABQ5K200_9EUKA|nr:putative multi-domain containing protein [Aduncisulcus paluster]|eukprot:gnl/Carplike_NY0171/554_a757_2963.p1 GENE.gnl/Carplike_NY0171/554_a757_2963~~gnl/Carplike_NY0171/554_a757_2963.p1  ORF type:complete len:166 (-),score=52.85 gnl/Carplike_NY0171/554_a757_2963:94-591(-)
MDYITNDDSLCEPTAYFFGYFGIAIAMSLSSLGSAFGIGKSGVGAVAASLMSPRQIVKLSLPVILAGVLGIFGLITSIIIMVKINDAYAYKNAYAHLAAGICTGVSALAAGLAIGVAGNAGSRACARNERLFTALLLCLVFGEALAIFGLLISLILSVASAGACP